MLVKRTSKLAFDDYNKYFKIVYILPFNSDGNDKSQKFKKRV